MRFTKYLMALGLAVFSANASAVLIGEVGVYDELVTSVGVMDNPDTLDNSGSGTEEAWIEDVLGMDIDYTQLAGSDYTAWEEVDGGAVGDVAFDLSDYDPDYFLVKVGGGGGAGTTDTHFLFENNDSRDWGYINLSVFGDDVDFGVISHVGVTDGQSVPEPGMLGLLAIGVLGMVVARRRVG